VDDGSLQSNHLAAKSAYTPPTLNWLRRAIEAIRQRPGAAAIVCLGICWGVAMHSLGWAQLAHFAQVRAFSHGKAEIDAYHWETNDKAWVVRDGEGHFYNVKSPGVAALSTPFYMGLVELDGWNVSQQAALNARETKYPRWAPRAYPPVGNYGYSRSRGIEVEHQIESEAPLIWALTLLVAVIPGVLLLLGVRWAADKLEPGYGTAAAITLGLASIVMIFAAEYFSHVISAALGFAAFLLLMREREGPPSLRVVLAAGAMAGLAVTFEYQSGLVGLALFFYALARSSERLKRAGAYAGGAVLGAMPALAFNWWALGSPLKFAYGDAVDEPGFNGHAKLGLNDDGFFGITMPKLDSAVELLLANRGLLVLTPVIAMAVVGIVLMRRRHRAEANVIAAIGIVYFAYNAGYWLPFGGGSPGARFMIPALPFLALGLAFAYRRFPATTLALAIPSFLFMGAAAISFPLIGDQGPGEWADFIEDGHLEHTLLTVLGVANPWVAIAPMVIAGLAAIALAAKATPATALSDLRIAVGAVVGWAALAAVGPTVAGDDFAPLDGDPNALIMIAFFAGLALVAIGVLGLRQRGAAQAPAPVGAEPALGERSS
jgi:hypothetical protein